MERDPNNPAYNFIPDELASSLPSLYETEGREDAMAQIKLFTPDSSWTFYIAEFDPESVAAKTGGLTGSDLRMVLREAVLEALMEERTTLTQEDIMDAVADFEERDNLKNMDMIDGDSDALVAGDGGQSEADDGHAHDHDDGHGHDH